MLSWSIYCLSDWAWWAAGWKKTKKIKNCGEEFNYVCASTEPGSADGRAQRHRRRIKDDPPPPTPVPVQARRGSPARRDQPSIRLLNFPSICPQACSPLDPWLVSVVSISAETWTIGQEPSHGPGRFLRIL